MNTKHLNDLYCIHILMYLHDNRHARDYFLNKNIKIGMRNVFIIHWSTCASEFTISFEILMKSIIFGHICIHSHKK